MACKIDSSRNWRRMFSDAATDDLINSWIKEVDFSHYPERRSHEWCLIRGLIQRQARKRGML